MAKPSSIKIRLNSTAKTGFFYVRIAYPKLSRSTTNHINMVEPGNQLIDLNY